jgi:hypothetical protein
MPKVPIALGQSGLVSKKSDANDIYGQIDSDTRSLLSVLSAVSDNKSLSLFNTISVANVSNPVSGDGQLQRPQPLADILVSRMNLTRKQYYSRINHLREAGLIRRKGARFILTSLGKVVYEIHKTIGFAIHNQWKLQAIDSLDTSLSAEEMPIEERHELISALLRDNSEIKGILCQSYVKNDYTLAAEILSCKETMIL